MDIQTVDKYGQGRVWTGEQAKEIGLVDEIGDLQDAIAYASEIAELEEYRIREYPIKKEPIEEIMEQFGIETVKENLLKKEMGVLYPYYKQTKNYQ